jgi:hypothetical protein
MITRRAGIDMSGVIASFMIILAGLTAMLLIGTARPASAAVGNSSAAQLRAAAPSTSATPTPHCQPGRGVLDPDSHPHPDPDSQPNRDSHADPDPDSHADPDPHPNPDSDPNGDSHPDTDPDSDPNRDSHAESFPQVAVHPGQAAHQGPGAGAPGTGGWDRSLCDLGLAGG